MPVRLGELLLKENLVSPQQLQEALNHQRMSGGKLGKAFVSLGFVKDEQITTLLSRQYGVPSIDLDHFEVDPAIIKIIPAETARKYQVLPLSRSKATLTIAMADPTNVFAMDDIKFMTGYNVEPVVASESAVEDSIEKYYGTARRILGLEGDTVPVAGVAPAGGGPTLSVDDMAAIGSLSEIDLDSVAHANAGVGTVKPADDEIDLGNLAKDADAAPVIKLWDVVLVDSLKRGASDIHVEPYEKEFRIRFRIDGVLYNVMALPMSLRDPLTQRIKVMARLNPTQKRLSQHGHIRVRFRVEDRSREVDFRVSVRPTQWGDTIALRLVDKSSLILDASRLGFEPHSLERFRGGLGRGRGLVLVSGPQRSGRTTTLYSAMAALNKPHANVVSVEDPVEFDLLGVNQISINREGGETPAAVLRSLRDQDVDAVVLGEIRDVETASLAVELAQGSLVLSTLGAEDAASTIARLLSMGVDPYLLATTTDVIVAQRLVRRICAKCKVDFTGEIAPRTLVDIGFPPDEVGDIRLMKGKGCGACDGTGYRGQVGLYEVMELSPGIRRLITGGGSSLEIFRRALEEGMLTLRQSGLEKIRHGVTTVEEVLRETVPGVELEPSRTQSERAPEGSRRDRPQSVGRGSSRERGHGQRVGVDAGEHGERAERAERRTSLGEANLGTPSARVVADVAAPAGESGAESLALQLAKANAEIASLRQRLLELSCSDVMVVQLANAKAEIGALRERLFELHSYRTAYERLLGGAHSPPRAGNG